MRNPSAPLIRQERYLRFDNIDMEKPDISSRCSRFWQKFSAQLKPDERVDDCSRGLRAEFDADREYPSGCAGNCTMAITQTPKPTDDSQSKNCDEKAAILLDQVAEKLVRCGQRVGVTPEEMVSLLDSGISIHDLLAFLASKSSGAA